MALDNNITRHQDALQALRYAEALKQAVSISISILELNFYEIYCIHNIHNNII